MKNIQILKKILRKLTKELRSIFEKNDIFSKLDSHNSKMLEENFWQDKSNSQKIIKEKKLFEDLINSYNYSVKQLKDLDDLYELALEENNKDIQNEVNKNISDLRLLAKKK